MICGPTASGKSHLADLAADLISERYSSSSPVAIVDSMQVYKELPVVTNQFRRRPAELVGIVSVAEEWTMARHRLVCDEVVEASAVPFVLDAGTGMYLNAIILDVPIAPRVPADARRRAGALASGATNPRRAAREIELELSGAKRTGSIWEGRPRYAVEVVYLRPQREELDAAIARRSSRIADSGLQEVASLLESFPQGVPNPSVSESIGVKELVEHLSGVISLEEAERRIRVRTRRLARRQMRWFDKLAKNLDESTPVAVVEDVVAAENAVREVIETL